VIEWYCAISNQEYEDYLDKKGNKGHSCNSLFMNDDSIGCIGEALEEAVRQGNWRKIENAV